MHGSCEHTVCHACHNLNKSGVAVNQNFNQVFCVIPGQETRDDPRGHFITWAQLQLYS